jgi:hypothetical protein
MRVRIVSNVDKEVARYSVVNKDFTRNPDGERIVFKLRNLPDFDNLDQYTDKEFREEFGRPRLEDDHGLVGYVFIDDELQGHTTTTSARQSGSGASADEGGYKPEQEEKHSKMDAAIAIYRANKNQGRKRVIHLFKQQLGMTQAGASSYYTKAMHAVENK